MQYGTAPVSAQVLSASLFLLFAPRIKKTSLTPMESPASCAESWRMEAKFTARAVSFLASLLSLKIHLPSPRKNRCSSASTCRWHKSFRRANSRARGAVGGSQGTELYSSEMADGIQCLLVQRELWGRKKTYLYVCNTTFKVLVAVMRGMLETLDSFLKALGHTKWWWERQSECQEI